MVHFCEHADDPLCVAFINCKYKRHHGVRPASRVHRVVPLGDAWFGFF